MVRVYLGVGSNLGDREKNLEEARTLLEKAQGIQRVCSSSVYETDPVDGPGQGRYLNAVWELETGLQARDLLDLLLAIEKQLGRDRSMQRRNEARTVDLDILFYGDVIMDVPGLTVPHPRLQDRFFVLRPLADLAPGWSHPKLNKTVKILLDELNERDSKP